MSELVFRVVGFGEQLGANQSKATKEGETGCWIVRFFFSIRKNHTIINYENQKTSNRRCSEEK